LEVQELVDDYPRLYRMGEDDSWPSIQANRLLSTASLLELFQVPEPRRNQLLTRHRPNVGAG
jgi:hypothetical protein